MYSEKYQNASCTSFLTVKGIFLCSIKCRQCRPKADLEQMSNLVFTFFKVPYNGTLGINYLNA